MRLMEGCVYLIGYQFGDSYRIKIGIARDVDRRLCQLQTGCPHKIYLLASVPSVAPRDIERQLHRKYAHYRCSGEWFGLPETAARDLLTTIERLGSSTGRSVVMR